jgi:CelD/BcsL family acetyltransferase involved in cellulose biosynthesis
MIHQRLNWRRQPAISAFRDRDVQQAWDRLNAQRGNLPFMSARAIRNAVETLGDGTELLLSGRDGKGTVCAMFVLTPDGFLRWRTFQPSQVPLGAWVAEGSRSIDELARDAMGGAAPLCLVLSITQIDPRLAARDTDTPTSRRTDYIPTGWLEIEGSFADYWAARGKNLRQNMRKQRNKLAADGVQTRMLVWRDRADMAPALERYAALETAGWKAAEGTAIHSGNAQGRYYIRLFNEAAEDSEAVIYEYRFDDRTVAMNLCLLRDGQLIVLKTAYDESIKSLSPAFLLREEELQSFFGESQVQRVEYYGRLMDWHTKLTDRHRTLYHLTCYRWAWLKQLAERRSQARATAATDEAADAAQAVPSAPDAAAPASAAPLPAAVQGPALAARQAIEGERRDMRTAE